MTATHESRTTQYAYDAANRLTSVDGVTYTWDDRGNLTNDGTFTYTYNAAGRMVRAESVTATLVYTYNANGLRVAQSVNGTETSFVWDWASGLPEMLSDGSNLYLVGHETLGQWDDAEWAYYLPDALGSIRQTTDDTGDITGRGGAFRARHLSRNPIPHHISSPPTTSFTREMYLGIPSKCVAPSPRRPLV